jgi:cytoskeleton protein RodZ
MGAGMPPIGETLREARMRQGLDISDVEQRTKIRAKYLRALENEDWGVLPGPTFVTTFLRTYADVLGVDAQLLVEEFRANHETSEEPELQPIGAGSSPRPRRRPPGPPGRGAVVTGVVVLFVAFILVLGLLGDNGGDGSEDVATDAPRTGTTPARPVRRRPRPAPAPVPEGVSVRIAPTVPTYACIDTGEGSQVLFEGILEEPRTFKNARELRLNLGKRSVAVNANGKEVTIAPSPEPVGLQVTPTAAEEIAEGSRPCA